MMKVPKELRQAIAQNIRNCRMEKFPGHGGGKRCAEAFGVLQAQWSIWESGRQMPGELRLAKLAEFFGVTVEELRKGARTSPLKSENVSRRIPDKDIPAAIPETSSFVSGNPDILLRIIDNFFLSLQVHGVRIDKKSLDYLAEAIKRPPS
jgi:transcriptional regulator with XRE-family HTH domain